MNRRRNEPRTHVSTFFALFLAAATAAGGGVLHAYFKNRQVQVAREIDAVGKRINQSRLNIRVLEGRMDEHLNRFAMRKQIEDNGSSLRPIPLGVVEVIDASASSRQSVASTIP